MPGKGKLIITGKLGDVMQESAQAAMSYVRSRAERARASSATSTEKIDIHVHVPEGAIPKDGPSRRHHHGHRARLGAAAASRCGSDVAMTGEITLRGRVLPIGGLKEKMLAAHRGGITNGAHPRGEREGPPRDPAAGAQGAASIVLVEHIDDVLREALRLEDPEELLRPKPVRLPDPPIEGAGASPHA